jgi:hypothetical protein
MGLFKDEPVSWDKINGLRDRSGNHFQRHLTPWSVGGNIGNQSQVEPFIWTGLPPLEDEWSGKEETDFLLRNGTLKDSATDITRISKLLTLTTRGKLFSVKQNLLSRLGVATEASGILNEGVYLPTSTLAQVGVVGLGGHLNKQGVNPFRKTGEVDNPDDGNTILGFDVTNPLGLPAYAQVVRRDQETGKNRLVGYFNNKINRTQKPSSGTTPSFTDKLKNRFIKLDGPNILDSYSGGPGSVVGVGYTTIRMSPEQRTGKNNVILDQSKFFAHTEDKDTPSDIASSVLSFTSNIFGFPTIPKATGEDFSIGSYTDYSVFKRPSSIAIKGAQIFNENASLSRRYEKLTKESTFLNRVTTTNEIKSLQLFSNSVYKKDDDGSITLDTNQDIANPTKSLSSTLTQEQLRELPQSLGPIIRPDFRKSLTKKPTETISNSLNYETQNIVNRVGVGDPGKRGDISDYQLGKRIDGKTLPVDKITAHSIYRSGLTAKNDSSLNDLVKFRIASVDPENPSRSNYIHFRAFLGSFSDSYNSSWSSQKFMGRAENFYNYEGFDRSISMNWTVPAQSKNELMIMHQKLNYLASNLAPDYVNDRYMAGPLVRLTVGGYLYEQYGFIESLSLNIPDNSPWEIAVAGAPEGGTEIEGGGGLRHDTSVKELPHVLEASISFKPIHDFVVQKQKLGFENGTVSSYGLQRYIALAASKPTNTGYNVNKTKPENTGKQ